ncbi:MAG: glycosyltransferase family 2 protein [Terracidiphilus sp.]
MNDEPLVSVVTPVYNGADFLAECIESILNQTYRNFEYIIVNNCSTDRTLDIALNYAKRDSRIQVHTNQEFVGVMENHNIGLNLISPQARYCKVVCADDFIFPECLTKMVELAEAHPSVGIVGSYQLSGHGKDGRNWSVKWTQLPYPSTVIPGRQLCRYQLLTTTYVFGSPSSTMYRADIVRSNPEFYPSSSPHSDTSAIYKYLKETDFGLVHQVLAYERVHDAAISATCRELNSYYSSWLGDLLEYGPYYLTREELDRRANEKLREYYGFLTESVFRRRGKEFWIYHKARLAECGHPLSYARLARGVSLKILDLLLNPKRTIESVLRRVTESREPKIGGEGAATFSSVPVDLSAGGKQ